MCPKGRPSSVGWDHCPVRDVLHSLGTMVPSYFGPTGQLYGSPVHRPGNLIIQKHESPNRGGPAHWENWSGPPRWATPLRILALWKLGYC